MWYKFINAIYEALDESDLNNIINSQEAYENAVKLISKINNSEVFKILGYTGKKNLLKGDFRVALRNNLRILRDNLEKSDDELNELLNKNNEGFVTQRQCYFVYFYIIEHYKLKIDNKDFYKNLLDSVGISYSPTIFSNMEEALMYFILNSKQNVDIWIGLVKDWHEVKEEYTKDLTPPVVGKNNIRTLTYNKLAELMRDGYSLDESNERATRKSLSIIKKNIDDVPKEILGSMKICEVFSEQTIRLILDAGARRQWYLLNIVKLILEKQIDALVYAYQRNSEADFEFIKSVMWVDRDVNDNNEEIAVKETWENVSVKSKYSSGEIKKALEESRIIPAKITKWLGRMVDPDSLIEDAIMLGDDEWITPLPLEGVKYIKGKYDEDLDDLEMWKETRRGETRVRSILTLEKENVTRELLLLMVLAAKLYGEDTLTIDYVTGNILFNSRYNDELKPERNKFDEYFLNVFDSIESEQLEHDEFIDRIKHVQEKSYKLEEYYYKEKKVSVFDEILQGHII